MKKNPKKNQFIKHIREVPIISSVCKKIDISRQTVHRWMNEDEQFKSEVAIAMNMGRDSINDLAESQLINSIKDGDLGATKFWLSSNHRHYVRPRPQSLIDLFDENNTKNIDKIEVTIIKSKEDLKKESEEKP